VSGDGDDALHRGPSSRLYRGDMTRAQRVGEIDDGHDHASQGHSPWLPNL